MYPGVQTVSLRGDGAWRGMTTLATNERGDRRFSLLENVYVSSDGSEIRTFPGWKTVVDFRTTLGESLIAASPSLGVGFDRPIYDGRRPVSYAGTAPYYENCTAYTSTPFSQSLAVFAKPTHLHGFRYVRGRWQVFGESDFRRELIQDAGSNNLTIASVSNTGGGFTDCDITLSGTYKNGVAEFNAVSDPSTTLHPPVVVYITGTGFTELDDKFHKVLLASPTAGATVIRIDTAYAGAGGLTPNGRIYRVKPGLALPGATGLSYYDPTSASGDYATDDPECLTVWEIRSAFDVNALQTSVSGTGTSPAFVANRQRDFGDSTATRYEGYEDDDYGRRRQKRIPYRLVPDVSGERLLLAAPGYGCVFQAPRVVSLGTEQSTPEIGGIPYSTNDLFDRPRCIGVPKAVMLVDNTTPAVNGYHIVAAPAGTGYEFPDPATVKIVVAYRDDATGEIGLPSEELSVTTTIASQGIRIKVMHPGYLMSECLAQSVVVFRTIPGGSTFYQCTVVDIGKYGLITAGTGLGNNVIYVYKTINVPYVTDVELQKNSTPTPVLEQLPMGAKAVKTVRNHTFYGGALGNSGPRREMVSGTVTTNYNGTSFPNYNEISFRHLTGNPSSHWGPSDTGWGCAQGTLPPAYAYNVSLESLSAFPTPGYNVLLSGLMNTVTVCTSPGSDVWTTAAYPVIRYQVENSTVRSGNSRESMTGKNAWAILERGLYQVSEANAPGVVASHSQWVNAEKEEDIEAIGQAGGGVVLCTRSNTYYMNWSRTPFLDGVEPVQPDQVSAEFGCIAPNSMVEFDGGCAWISDRGPCAFMGGGVTWIGQDLERFFVGETSRYKRDSEGMMRHSWACHDAERGLVYFGVFADRESASITNRVTVNYRGTDFNWSDANPAGTYTADEANSRFPCDEVLIWSYRTNAWSRWVPPVGLEVLWMERGYDADGAQRVFFLAADWRIYALDDSYADTNKYGVELTLATAGSASSVVVTGWGTDESARDTSNAFLRVGMGVYIRSARGVIRGTSTIAGLTTGTNTITFADTLTWLAGDTLVAGARTATITSNWMNLSGEGSTKAARKLTTRYNLWGPAASTDSAKAAEAAVAATVTTNKRVDNTEYTDSRQVSDLTGELPAVWMGKDYLASLTGRTISMEKGIAIGQEMQVSMTIYHTSQVRVADLAIEAP